ncbi:amidase family protein [Phenylobacterium sp. LjRoot225]|uniref:amidase family protein n=1 Tax=Phenylobacterium sp. LjRoot225 TaxID=3342285 RepID=UPI003ECE746E
MASPDVRHLLAQMREIPTAAYLEALQRLPPLRAAYDDLLADDGLAALLTPTTPTPAIPIAEADFVSTESGTLPSFPTLTRFTRPDSMAGLPSLSVPSGNTTEGLPIGLQLIGARDKDTALIALAEAAAPIFAG